MCVCIDGFSGFFCEVNVDDCLLNLCGNGFICRDGLNSYSCDCVCGFFGEYCDVEIDECVFFFCYYGGICNDQVIVFVC